MFFEEWTAGFEPPENKEIKVVTSGNDPKSIVSELLSFQFV